MGQHPKFKIGWGIRYKYVAVASVLLMVFTAVVTWQNTKSQEAMITQKLMDKAKGVASLLKESSVNPIALLDILQLRVLVGNVREDPEVSFAYIYNEGGRILSDGTEDNSLRDTIPQDTFGRRALSTNEYVVAMGSDTLDVAIPIFLSGTRLGGARIGFSLLNMKRAVIHVRNQNLLFGLGFIFLGIVLSWFLSGLISRPILSLAKATEAVAQGDLTRSLDITSQDELGLLCQSFNQMVQDLKETTISKNYFDGIFNQMADTLVVLSMDGRITKVNRATCDLLKYKEEELLGEPFHKILGDQGFEERFFTDFKNGSSLQGIETFYLSKAKVKIPVHFSSSLLEETQGSYSGIICVARDITQLKKKEKFAAIGQLAATVAHELRNPLGTIQNTLFIFKDSLKDTELVKEKPKLLEYLDMSKEEIRRANRIVTELLEFSRDLVLRPHPTEIRLLISESLKAVTLPSRISCSFNGTDQFPSVLVDPEKMRQVFINVITNAVQAMANGGELKISLNLEGQTSDFNKMLRIDFSDTGCGIKPEDLKRVFEPLFTTKIYGTGLGLAFCQQIVQAHGGKIDVASEMGKGSTVSIKIPLATSSLMDGGI